MCLKSEHLPHDRASKTTFQEKKKLNKRLSLYKNLLHLKDPQQHKTDHLFFSYRSSEKSTKHKG